LSVEDRHIAEIEDGTTMDVEQPDDGIDDKERVIDNSDTIENVDETGVEDETG
jgi:hypothetical protein